MREGGEVNTIPTVALLEPTGDEGLTEALEQLKATVAHFDNEVDKKDPRVLHVFDSRLRLRNGYAFDRTIKDIDFTGTVQELVSAISKMGIPISFPRVAPIGESRDFDMTVHVEGRSLSVRDALTRFLTLGKRRLLWVATARLADGAATDRAENEVSLSPAFS